jgi:hypothetical protein
VYCGRTKFRVQISGIVSRRREKIIITSRSDSVGRSEYWSTSKRSTSRSGSVGRREYQSTSRRIIRK